jgi:hypothetical protein
VAQQNLSTLDYYHGGVGVDVEMIKESFKYAKFIIKSQNEKF